MPDRRKRKPVDVEARIRSEYSKLRAKHRANGGEDYYDPCCHGGPWGMSNIFMQLATRWKMPIVKIKHIVNYKGAANKPIVYQTAEEHRLNKAHIKADAIRREMYWEERWRK